MNITEANDCDALSLALAGVSWPSWTSGVWNVSDGWSHAVDVGTTSFYAIREGRCRFTSPGVLEHPVDAEAGDLVLFPQGSAHRVTVLARASEGDVWGNGSDGVRAQSGDRPSAVIVYGHFRPQRVGDNPLQRLLSSFLHLKVADYQSLRETPSLLRMIVSESAARRPGYDAVVNQLVQVLFHQSLRAFTLQNEALSDQPAQLFDDSAIGLVVGLLHAQPEKAWTVAGLARWVRMSRSAFSERFREVVGKPPLQFLTELRMERACELLTTTELGVKQIAAMVGYESPSSFTNAFKRLKGASPQGWRAKSRVVA